MNIDSTILPQIGDEVRIKTMGGEHQGDSGEPVYLAPHVGGVPSAKAAK